MGVFKDEAEAWRVAVEMLVASAMARTFSDADDLRDFIEGASSISDEINEGAGRDYFTHHFDRLLSQVRVQFDAQQRWLRDQRGPQE